ncbi:SDR family NAD(P)-dependent oxidoreductase [Frankia sp. AgB1.9]|uniref:oxidoreductase n=1 Tax=unclassified Frankia TaxID=2632575 RepID=UPI001931A4A8|nr:MULTISPECIES: oxidoreductase [unclassified Frankia]MBL7491617.1 SDR family NAD(P)-dependent oxidoreductase [Frankia sp. AgW1.1]MBL7553838.1 SDR family NAD(P)-dependent oxidoreductase [Frankia sp. AgB1.9]MBL7618083.1 SDR family NAD(P)-dependent oxidoreductase [Frankia sp. AgB1.8]
MADTRTRHRWTDADIPDQQGRTVVVTGGNTGLGFETARMLARRGASIVLACRNEEKAAAAAERIETVASPDAEISTVPLDLASLASVHRAAERLRAEHPRIDLLINNAGGVRPRYGRTEDGFELTLATNHLGPFALTGLVLDRLLTTSGSRIVTVSSIGHRRGPINFDDLQSEHGYRYNQAYFQSKLANLMFTYELQRRLAAAERDTLAVAAHPGNARTEFGRDMNVMVRAAMSPRLRIITSWMLQSPHMGALAIARAAADPTARGGDYYGPPGRSQFTGHPARVESSPRSHDQSAQLRLWQESERLTGVTVPLPPPSYRQA